MCHQERSWRRAKEMPPHLRPPEPPRCQPAPSASLCSHQLLPVSPHWARRCSSPKIKADKDLAVGFRQAQVRQSCGRTWMKDTSGSNKASNKPWAPPQLSKLASLSFQNPKQPLSRLNFAASRRKTNQFLPPCWDGLALNNSLVQEGVLNYFWFFISADNSSSHILISSHGELLCPQSHRPVSMGTLPIHRNSHKVMNECTPPGRRDHSWV